MENNLERKWQVCVCGVLKCDGEYLMIKRNFEDDECAGFWEMPSGKVEFGESVSDGLKREVMEEVGIDITSFEKRIISVSEYDSKKSDVIKYNVQLNYVVDVPTKKLSIRLSGEHTDYVWVTGKSEYVDDFIAEIINAIEAQEEKGSHEKIKKM